MVDKWWLLELALVCNKHTMQLAFENKHKRRWPRLEKATLMHCSGFRVWSDPFLGHVDLEWGSNWPKNCAKLTQNSKQKPRKFVTSFRVSLAPKWVRRPLGPGIRIKSIRVFCVWKAWVLVSQCFCFDYGNWNKQRFFIVLNICFWLWHYWCISHDL